MRIRSFGFIALKPNSTELLEAHFTRRDASCEAAEIAIQAHQNSAVHFCDRRYQRIGRTRCQLFAEKNYLMACIAKHAANRVGYAMINEKLNVAAPLCGRTLLSLVP
jgi:hypothetical protein